MTIKASTKRVSPTVAERRARSLEIACQCAKVAEEMRGKDTLVLDLTGSTPIVDYFVITTGTSGRQMRSLASEVDRVIRASGSRPLGMEGQGDSTWILHDFGDIVLHVFSPEARKLYDLEHLWGDARRVDWKALLQKGN